MKLLTLGLFGIKAVFQSRTSRSTAASRFVGGAQVLNLLSCSKVLNCGIGCCEAAHAQAVWYKGRVPESDMFDPQPRRILSVVHKGFHCMVTR